MLTIFSSALVHVRVSRSRILSAEPHSRKINVGFRLPLSLKEKPKGEHLELTENHPKLEVSFGGFGEEQPLKLTEILLFCRDSFRFFSFNNEPP